jgi:Tfp pilus assembly protein PilN
MQNADFKALDSLKKQVTKQRNFVKQTNITQSSRTSFYADRLASSIPMGLELTELNIFPISGNRKEYRENQLVKFQNETIIVKGICDNSINYNEWIKKVQGLNWVHSAMHMDYKDINSNLGAFELKILIAPSK